jgi:hypothetical protein
MPVATVIGKAFWDIGHAPKDGSNRRKRLPDYAIWEIHQVIAKAHRTSVNAVLLHRGHLPAASSVTGFVKCFVYRHSLHCQRIECSCCASAI